MRGPNRMGLLDVAAVSGVDQILEKLDLPRVPHIGKKLADYDRAITHHAALPEVSPTRSGIGVPFEIARRAGVMVRVALASCRRWMRRTTCWLARPVLRGSAHRERRRAQARQPSAARACPTILP